MTKRSYKACNHCTKVNEIGTICQCGYMTESTNPKARPLIQCYNYFSENLDAYVTGPAQRRRLMRERNLEEAG